MIREVDLRRQKRMGSLRWRALRKRWGGGPLMGDLKWAFTMALLASFIFFTEKPATADIPDKTFFENYIAAKAKTYSVYLKEGIGPYMAMTLANNTAFRCVTSGGEEVDFEGYVEIYKYTFDHFAYRKIEPAGVEINRIDDDHLLVIYTMSMAGRTRAGSTWQVERRNEFTFMRIKAGDGQRMRELNPQNLDKYFDEQEDKWIVTRIEYE
jgi:hypothetical protein